MGRFIAFQLAYATAHARALLGRVRRAGAPPLAFVLWILGRGLPRGLRRAAGLARWALTARFGPRVGSGLRERCCVVLPSFRRVANMDLIVRACLQCDFVGRVVVSNNNPAYRLAAWVRVRDPRLHLIDQEQVTRQGIRLVLARDQPFDYVLTIDDDRFLRATQIEALFRHLLADPSVPHGIEGERRADDGEPTEAPGYPYRLGVSRADLGVDTLTGVYGLTRAHITTCFEQLAGLGVHDLRAFANGEDIVMSYSGAGDARIHDLGRVEHCFASWAPAIATSVGPGFFDERLALKRRLAALRPRVR